MRMTYNPTKINMGLGDVPGGPSVAATAEANQSVTNQIIEAVGKIMPLVRQQQIFNAQLKAAKSGTVLNTSGLPTDIGIQVGMDSNTKMMLGIGIGALALILLMKKR